MVDSEFTEATRLMKSKKTIEELMRFAHAKRLMLAFTKKNEFVNKSELV